MQPTPDDELTPLQRYESQRTHPHRGFSPFDEIYDYAVRLERDLAAARRALKASEASLAALQDRSANA